MTNESSIPNRFSGAVFGGGEDGELRAYEALEAHKAALLVGTKVRVYRGRQAGMEGTVEDSGVTTPHYSVCVRDSDGMRWTVEAMRLELA
jgi:hypothetical protein